VGEANAGVARGSFYYCSAGFEKTAVLGILNDIEGSTILDGATRVLELCFS
jgi:hypothetical protein